MVVFQPTEHTIHMKNFPTEQETVTDESGKPPISAPSDVNPAAADSPASNTASSSLAGAKQSGGDPKKAGFLYWLKTAAIMIASAFLVAFSAHCLLSPNNFATGGATGIAVILEKAFGIPQSRTVLCINAPLIIISFFAVKKRFAFLTLCNVGLQTLWLFIMEKAEFPPLVFDEKIFAAIFAGIFMGAAIALALKTGGSSGGMDIIAVIVQKKISASSIAWILFVLNCAVISSSFFVYKDLADTAGGKILPIVMAICEQYVESKVTDMLINGMQSAIEFRVVTDKPEEMAKVLFANLERGVTSITVKGMYTHAEHALLLCVVSRRQVNAFKRLVKEVDPASFVVMSKVSQVLGYGFYEGDN